MDFRNHIINKIELEKHCTTFIFFPYSTQVKYNCCLQKDHEPESLPNKHYQGHLGNAFVF